MFSPPFTVALIVPTGIGASIGGYAGDALPVARAIAQVSDYLITHPNVLNGAQLYWSIPNALYTEGYALDQFAAGNWGLAPVRQNRIGLILDRGIAPELRWRQLQVADAARATLGLALTDYVVTDAPLGVELRTAKSGATWGTIENPDSLLRAVERAIQVGGAEAIAVVARFPDDPDAETLQNYRQGQGVDPLAGAEAVISHLVVRQFQVPCAHAPALFPLPLDPQISPRSAAEELGYTFLPCVLVGLSRAPQFVTSTPVPIPETLSGMGRFQDRFSPLYAHHVNALIAPAGACGGSAILSWAQSRTQIITVRENTTRTEVAAIDLGIGAIAVETYWEAIGVLAALKAGVDPQRLRGAIAPIRELI
jgi:hypothetical protein